jgi:hypothetical protein
MCNSSKLGVEKSILSEQWKVEGDDVSVSCESKRERESILGGNVSRLQLERVLIGGNVSCLPFLLYPVLVKDKNHTHPFPVFMFNRHEQANERTNDAE